MPAVQQHKNGPTLKGQSSTTTAIDPGDLDTADRTSRAPPIQVLTCSGLDRHADHGPSKVTNDNSTTNANPPPSTRRMRHTCTRQSPPHGNQRLPHVGRGAPATSETPAHLPTTTVAASDPRVGPPRTVASMTRKNFTLATQGSAGGQLSGHLRRRSWWVNLQVFPRVLVLHGQHAPPVFSRWR
jgi:hypothetical protein